MDLNPIGKHCALKSCNVLDFLPIQCSCLEWFCKLHISPDLHHCSSLKHDPSESSSSAPARSKCAFLGCHKPSLETRTTTVDLAGEGDSSGIVQRGCPSCQLSFCVYHRHVRSHSCTGLTASKDDTTHGIARAILAQNFLASSTPISHTPVVVRQRRNIPPDSQRSAQLQKVNLMKLRHKAVPGDPKDRGSVVPIDQRIHITVRIETAGQLEKENMLWFRKTTIAGKALDLVVQHFGISHTDSMLYLKQSSAEIGSRALQNHLELSAQLEDGSTVVLTDSPSNG